MYLLKDLTAAKRQQQLEIALKPDPTLFSNHVRNLLSAVLERDEYAHLREQYAERFPEIESRYNYHLPGSDIGPAVQKVLGVPDLTPDQISERLAGIHPEKVLFVRDASDWREKEGELEEKVASILQTSIRPALAVGKQEYDRNVRGLELDRTIREIVEDANFSATSNGSPSLEYEAVKMVRLRETDAKEFDAIIARDVGEDRALGVLMKLEGFRDKLYMSYFHFALPPQVSTIDKAEIQKFIGQYTTLKEGTKLFDYLGEKLQETVERVFRI